MHKSPHIEKIAKRRYRTDREISYEVASLYCDFVENFIRSGGKLKGLENAYFNIYEVLLASDVIETDCIPEFSIIIGGELEQYQHRKPFHRKLCSLSSPLQFDPPQFNLDILREMRRRGIETPLHDIMPIDDIDEFGKFITEILYSENEQVQNIFIEKVISDIFNDTDYETIKTALKSNKDWFSYSYERPARKIVDALKEAVEPLIYAEHMIKAWKPIRI